MSLGLAAGFAGFAKSQALWLRDAQVRSLNRWARQEARALNFWLHEAQGRPGFRLPGVGSARQAGGSGAPDGHVFDSWVERRVSQAEDRVLSVWADAGATWLLQNRREIARAARPRDITAVVTAPALWPDSKTPHRNRAIRLLVRSTGAVSTAGTERAQLVAVAGGLVDPVLIPTAGDGVFAVGMVRMWNDSPSVIGPAPFFDLGPWIRQIRVLAAPGDMVAIREVSANAGDLYLHRSRVPSRPELNRMETDLNMDGRSITVAGRISASKIVTTRIDGPLTVRGGLTVTGTMNVERNRSGGGGHVTLPAMTIRQDLKAATVTATGVTAGTVNARNARIGNLVIERGRCSGC